MPPSEKTCNFPPRNRSTTPSPSTSNHPAQHTVASTRPGKTAVKQLPGLVFEGLCPEGRLEDRPTLGRLRAPNY
jgi:hypothetical protein